MRTSRTTRTTRTLPLNLNPPPQTLALSPHPTTPLFNCHWQIEYLRDGTDLRRKQGPHSIAARHLLTAEDRQDQVFSFCILEVHLFQMGSLNCG